MKKILLFFLVFVISLSFCACSDSKGSADDTLEDDIVEGYIAMGQYAMENGQNDVALRCFDNALRMNPEYAMVYTLRATVYIMQGDFKKALDDMNKSIELTPGEHESGYFSRGMLYFWLGEYANALVDFSKAIEINPNYMNSYKYRAEIYEIMGEDDLSAADYAMWKLLQENQIENN